jgi:catechol 2,3-dioxygenase-like lactoylglutathione lyase family enzyme
MSHVRRFDHVGITVADLDAVTAFFVGLGLEVENRMFVEGEFLDTIIGITDSRTEIVMLRPPDGGAPSAGTHGAVTVGRGVADHDRGIEAEPAFHPFPGRYPSGARRILAGAFLVEALISQPIAQASSSRCPPRFVGSGVSSPNSGTKSASRQTPRLPLVAPVPRQPGVDRFTSGRHPPWRYQ